MHESLEHELASHAQALRALARLLVGDQHADDLVQDTALQALAGPPPRPEGLRGWLRAVLRHRAGKQQRGERRRRAREAAAPAPEPAIGPAEIAAQREAVQRLHDALMGAAEPYRGTLLLRFFEDLTPTAIAARTGVPLATVKSRLQRGLALLRERLDADGGRGDWRAAFAGAFGIERALPVGGAAALTGVLLMGTGVKLALGGVAAAAFVAAAIVLGGGGAPPPSTARGEARDGVAAASAARTDAGALPVRERAAPQPAGPPVAGEGALATFSGRCVDEAGLPLAGVRLHAVSFVSGNHSMPLWTAPPDQQTGGDGRFAVRFGMPEHLMVRIELKLAGRCPTRGEFESSDRRDRDLGDVVLWPEVVVRGRLVDAHGTPVGGVTLDFKCDEGVRNDVGPQAGAQVRTRADGTFGPVTKLPPGRGSVVAERHVLRGEEVGFALDPKQSPIDLQLELVDEDTLPSIRGVVVDDAGRPIAGAWVCMESIESETYTAPDGTFCVRRMRQSQGEGPFWLVVMADGLERAQVGPHALGTTGLRIVLRRDAGLRVRARDPAGKPVEEFGVAVFEREARLQLGRCTGIQRWPQGVARVADVRPGELAIAVLPRSPDLVAALQPVAFGGAAEITVDCVVRQHRRLVVLYTDGAPVVGADVELLDAAGSAVAIDTCAYEPAVTNPTVSGSWALLLQRGLTDANGELALSGPGGQQLVLRLRGGGLALQVLSPVRLDDATPLVVTAARGASWSGRLVPADVVAGLVAAERPRADESRRPHRLGLSLRRGDEVLGRANESPLPIADDGSFRIDGLPAGTWEVTVATRDARWAAGAVSLAAGQQLERDLDVSPLRLSRVSLRVLVDGAPLANVRVILSRENASAGGAVTRSLRSVQTDDRGCIAELLHAGSLSLYVNVPDGKGNVREVLAPDFDVPLGADVERIVDLRLAAAVLRVRTAAGAPAGKVALALTGPSHERLALPAADAAGAVDVPVLAAGTYTVLALPRSLCDPAAANALVRERGVGAMADAWLVVGTIAVAPGANAPFTLELPAAWDR